MSSAAMHGAMILALGNNIRYPATVEEMEIMSAPRAGLTRMKTRASSTSSTPRNGMANAMAAHLLGTGITAIKRGISMTALSITTLGG